MTDKTDSKERAGRFTKKPVTIDAWLIDFGNKPLPDWVNEAFRTAAIDWCPAGEGLYINTLEGHMLGTNGSWLIKGVQGELYACKPDIFAATYERASLAVSAGSGPLMGQPQAMPDLSALTERGAKAWAGVDAQGLREGFTAADMATAEARGFRDGVASVAASAGNEPVAVAEVSCTHVHGWGTRWIVDADRKLNIPPLGTKLYARPPAPKQGQKDSSRLRKALIRAQQAINSMKVEAETAAQGDKRMMLEACETISNEGLQADMAIRDVLANHPSPPEGMVGGWISVEDVRKPPPGKPVVFWVWAERYQEDDDGRQIAQDASGLHLGEWREAEHGNYFDNYSTPFADREAVLWWMDPAPPTTSAGSGKGE